MRGKKPIKRASNVRRRLDVWPQTNRLLQRGPERILNVENGTRVKHFRRESLLKWNSRRKIEWNLKQKKKTFQTLVVNRFANGVLFKRTPPPPIECADSTTFTSLNTRRPQKKKKD